MTVDRITIKDAADQEVDVAVDTFDTDNNVQIVKLGIGAEDAAPTLVSTSNPLPISDAGGAITVDGSVSLAAALPAGTNNIGDVDVLTLPALPAGTNAIGKLAANSGIDIGDVDVTSVLPGTGATNLGKAEDAAHTTGDVGVMMLAVRRDTPTALAADNDYMPPTTDSAGRIWVNASGAAIPITDNSGSLTVDGSVSIGAALPAGANNIGDVDVLTVPADPFGANADAAVAAGASGSIQAKLRRATQGLEDLKSLIVLAAGDNNIGNVDVLTLPGAAHDAAVSGNPVRIGAKASTASQSAVSADGDTVDLWADRNGRVVTRPNAPVDRIVSGTLNRTNTTAADVIAAQGAGVKLLVTAVLVVNAHATVGTKVSIRAGTTVKYTGYAAAVGGGFALASDTGLFLTAANEAVTAVCGTTGADVDINVTAVQTP